MFSRKHIGAVAALVVVGLVAAGVLVVGDEQPVAPTVTQPAPRGLDDQGDLRLIRQTPTRIVLGWTPELTSYGYLFSGDDTVVARTTDPARSTATFRNIYTSYEVAAIDKGDTGTYSPLAGTLAMTVIAETVNTITFGWTPQAEYGYLFSGDGDVISRTYDPDRSYAKFNKSYTDYEVAVLVKGVTGTYPPQDGGPQSCPPPPDYPDDACTGVPVGTQLTAYAGPDPITVDNTIVDSKTMGCIGIEADNVTIKNSLIDASCQQAVEVNSGSLTIMDSTISCDLVENSMGIDNDISDPPNSPSVTALRVAITRCENGIQPGGNMTVEDSYIHALSDAGADPHSDGLQFPGNTDNLDIIHNTIFGMQGDGDTDFGTSSFIADLAGHDNWLVEYNLFAGGAYTIYCPTSGSNWVFRNNAFSRRFSENYGYFGYAYPSCNDEANWTGNFDQDTLAVLDPT